MDRLTTNTYLLRGIYYPWIVLPYPVRRVVTIAGVWWLQVFKRVRGIHRRHDLTITRPEKLFSLSFWGVPAIKKDFVLTVDGNVERPFRCSLEDLKNFSAVERKLTLDCVGGIRNNCVMREGSFLIPA